MPYCQKCKKTLKDVQFYTYKNGEKTELCKKCLTMHVDPYNPDTFLWILEKMDVPWLPWEWDPLLARAAARGGQYATGSAIMGKYLGKMRLGQWGKMGWANTEAENEKRRKLTEDYVKAHGDEPLDKETLHQKYVDGEISEAQYKTMLPVETPTPPPPPPKDMLPEPVDPYKENDFLDEVESPAAQLSQEDKIYLAMKWGRNYHAEQWIKLDRMYEEMCNSFDISDADSKINLRQLCKTWLKAEEAIDVGDVDSYQKLNRVAESQRKSGNFTAAQNKKEKDDFVDCVGNLVAYCEREGGKIPRFDISAPRDLVDKEIQDQKDYVHALIYEDKALAQQIETYLKKRELLDEKVRKKLLERAGIKEDDELNDDDFMDRFNEISREVEHDLAVQSGSIDNEDNDENSVEGDDEYGFVGFDSPLRQV